MSGSRATARNTTACSSASAPLSTKPAARCRGGHRAQPARRAASGQFATREIVVSESDRALVVRRCDRDLCRRPESVMVKQGRAREQRIRTGRREGERVEASKGWPAATSSSGPLAIWWMATRSSELGRMKKCLDLHRPAGLRRDDRALARGRRRGELLPPRVDRFPRVDLPQVAVRTTLPSVRSRRPRSRLPSRWKRRSTRSRGSPSCAPSPGLATPT